MILAGPEAGTAEQWRLIEDVLPLKQGFDDLDVCIGIRTRTVRVSRTRVRVVMDQCEYTDYCIEAFRKHLQEVGVKTPLSGVTTPAIREAERPELWKEGLLKGVCRQHIGSLMYLARGTRHDLLFAVRQLCKAADRWTVEQDLSLIRIYRYLTRTRELGAALTVDSRDAGQLTLSARSDSDHAGDRDTRKSTTGGVTRVVGPWGTDALVSSVCKGQGAIARSSGAAEVAAADHVVCRQMLPSLLGVLAPHIGDVELGMDSSAGIAAIKKGYSRLLTELSVTQGVQLGWVHEMLLNRMGARLVKVDGTVNVADVHTKALGAEKFTEFRRQLGIAPAA